MSISYKKIYMKQFIWNIYYLKKKKKKNLFGI
jgi:hypothetical protein